MVTFTCFIYIHVYGLCNVIKAKKEHYPTSLYHVICSHLHIVIMIIYLHVFTVYLLILGVGIWAGRKKEEGNDSEEEVMLAGRNIGLFVGIFTMTGMCVVLEITAGSL